MAEEVPGPGVLDCLNTVLGALGVDRANLVEAAELTGPTRSSLQPYDEGDFLVLPGEGKPLPEGVVDGRLSGDNVLVAGIGLVE